MAFAGVREHRLDPKDRVVIPAAWADEIRTRSQGRVHLVLSRRDPCLQVLPHAYFEALAAAHQPDPLVGATDEQRVFFHGVEPAELQGPGRVLIPRRFMPLFPARVVAVCGMGTYLELWDPATYREQVARKATAYPFPGPKDG
jgi:DNA-binding transcriptional regulator/RsmH inhibitor MraZ